MEVETGEIALRILVWTMILLIYWEAKGLSPHGNNVSSSTHKGFWLEIGMGRIFCLTLYFFYSSSTIDFTITNSTN